MTDAVRDEPDLAQLPNVLTVDQILPILKISRNHAYKLIRDNVIPHRRLGRDIRIPKAELLRWLGAEIPVKSAEDQPRFFPIP